MTILELKNTVIEMEKLSGQTQQNEGGRGKNK